MYSNCLFEAIKAKIKDPKHVHIHYLPRKINPTHHIHFYWYTYMPKNPIINYIIEDFVHSKKDIHQNIWFDGNIRQEDVKIWENFLRKILKEKGYTKQQIKNFEKKKNFVTKS